MALKFKWRNQGAPRPPGVDTPVGGSDGFHEPFGPRPAPIEPYVQAFTRHAQPDPGMAAVSWDTLQLPVFTPVGTGIQNKRQWLEAPSNPVVYQRQAVQITTVGNPGFLTGTFVATPLLDTRSGQMGAADALGISAIPMPGEFVMPMGTF